MGAALDITAELDEAAQLLEEAETRIEQVSSRRWVPHDPFPKQQEFLDAPEFELLYGGQVGGGKSDVMLMDALADVDVPGFSALILRKTYQDLAQPGGLMDRALEWLAPTAARWNDTNKRWTFPSSATLSFGYLPNEAARFQFQGGEYQSVNFDELTQIRSPIGYLYLHSRVRRTHGCLDAVKLRVRGGTNPGGEGHDWVAERFGINEQGEQDPAKAWDEQRGEVRRFISAGLRDNPYIDADAYEPLLAGLDAVTRAQYMHGLWVKHTAGLVLPLANDNFVNRIVPDLVPILGIDMGTSESEKTLGLSVVAYSPRIPDLVWVLHVEKHAGMLVKDLAARVRDLEAMFGGFQSIVMDEGALGSGFGRELRRRYTIPVRAATKRDRLGYSRLLHDAAVAGDLLLHATAAQVLRDEAARLMWHEDGKRMLGACHAYDATMYAWREARAYMAEIEDEPPPLAGTPEASEHWAREFKKKRALQQLAERKKKWWKR